MRKRSLFLFLILTLTACNVKTGDTETYLFETAIRRYNRALADAYRELTIDPLQEIASEREMGKIDMIIKGFRAKNQYMESELKGIEFKKIEKKGANAAEVATKEIWRYRHLDKKAGEEAKPWVETEYELLYYMIKSDGNWIVGSVEFIKEAK